MRAAVVVLLLAGSALAESPDIRPPPRGHWVVDTTGTLTPPTVAAIESLAAQLDASGKGQLGVLVVSTTNGAVPRGFATQVFNSWGIGHAPTNDGVFLFAALKDRKAEIVLGTNSTLRTSDTDQVMSGTVVPCFKRGDPNAALRDGAAALVALLQQKSANDAAQGSPLEQHPAVESALHQRLAHLARGGEMFADRSPRSWVLDYSEMFNASARAELEHQSNEVYADGKGRLFYLVVRDLGSWPQLDDLVRRLRQQLEKGQSAPLAIVAWDSDTGLSRISLPAGVSTSAWQENLVTQAQQHLADAPLPLEGLKTAGAFAADVLAHGLPPRPMGDVLHEGFEQFSGLLAVAGGLGVVVLFFVVRRAMRLHPRTCTCGRPMQRLGEVEDDQYLDAAQRTEENIGSVDYDVWHCGVCHAVKVIAYNAIFSRYSQCEGCGARTASSTSTTLTYATEYSGGTVRVDTSCSNCSHTSSRTRTTARLSSSSSSSSWSSSSSSSSSSSFGGGSSSGSGSSGSW